MENMKKIILIFVLSLFYGLSYAETFESSVRQVTLLELYSSEGCSSCPPADEWLRGFKSQSTIWKDFVPVVFHVDYWDGLGWKDPFSSADFTKRQEDYVRLWRGSSLYTPNVVINGKDWRHWNRLKTLPIFNESPGVLKVNSDQTGKLQITFQPATVSSEKYSAHAALLGFDMESVIQRGENSGKTLQHDFVALDYQSASLEGAVVLSVEINLKINDSRAKKIGIAVWVTLADSPAPVQATGGYLNE